MDFPFYIPQTCICTRTLYILYQYKIFFFAIGFLIFTTKEVQRNVGRYIMYVCYNDCDACAIFI